MKITVDREIHERLKLYSEVTGKTMYETVEEALNFWMDTCGGAEILIETGVEIVPEWTSSKSTSASVTVH